LRLAPKFRPYGFLVAVVLLHGCATAPHRPMGASFLMANRVTIGSVGYLPAPAILQQGSAQGTWDPEALIWTLRAAGSHELRLSPQMSVVLVDGLPQSLPNPPLMKEGQLLLPEFLWTQWIGRWMTPTAPVTVPPSGVSHLRTIVVDAGHGGHDVGAIGRAGLREKSVNLDVALRLRDLLEKEGFRVIMTRDTDTFIPLGRRSQIANQASADLFVSIHANATRGRSPSGYEVYYLSEATNDTARALEAAENGALPSEVGEPDSEQTEAIVWDLLYTENRTESTELAAHICRGLKGCRLPSQNRGVKSARFAVLKGSRMPAILVEVGFLSHPVEESNLRTASYRQRLAEGIRNGIVAFKRDYEQRF